MLLSQKILFRIGSNFSTKTMRRHHATLAEIKIADYLKFLYFGTILKMGFFNSAKLNDGL